jgi:integrase
MLDGIAHRAGPVMADRTLAYLRAALNWYAARADDWQSPLVRGMTRLAAEERTRVLDDTELRRIWAGTADGAPFSRLVRVLLLTGQRRSEVAGMQWSELSAVWSIPSERYKSGRPTSSRSPRTYWRSCRRAGPGHTCSASMVAADR